MTRASRMDIGYLGKNPEDPKDSIFNRTSQREVSKRKSLMIANTVGELIGLLQKMDPAGRVYTIEPPFDGLKLVPQGDGAVLFSRPRAANKGTIHERMATD